MGQQRGSKTREDIAEGLYRGAMLLVRHLARGTSLAHRTVLATLEEDGPTRLTALAAANGVSQPAMTQLVGRLERDGLVIRLIDPDDARATLVDITDTGRALRAELHEAQNDQLAELLDAVPRRRGHAGLGHARCHAAHPATDPAGRVDEWRQYAHTLNPDCIRRL